MFRYRVIAEAMAHPELSLDEAAARAGVTIAGTARPSVGCRGLNRETTSFESRKRRRAEPAKSS